MRETAPGRWSTAEQGEIWTRWRRGESFRSIGRHFGTHLHAIRRFVARTGGGRGQLRDTVSIRERPAEVEDRAVPGHWEGDLVFGRGASAVGTLVERTTRYVALFPVPAGHTAPAMRAALAAAVARVPEQLRRSLTWDQGKEMAEHARFTVDTGLPVYFCAPRSSWQRGTNENTNGLLRQYLPKSADLKPLGQAELDAIAAELNGRPRQTLGWHTPAARFLALAEAG
jgi:IS30 family transposase